MRKRLIAAVYAANPRILGVVRATADFYARTKQPKQAVATLLAAARVSTPTLARSLHARSRGARRTTPATPRKAARSRSICSRRLRTILRCSRWWPASYAGAKDNAGLKEFYLAQLDAVQHASLTRDERKADTARLRAAAASFPRSPALGTTRAPKTSTWRCFRRTRKTPRPRSKPPLYALAHHRETQLTGFLETTVKQSPQDSRFAVLLAEVETTFENLPAALSAYDQAISVRKDRADLYQARVELELRLNKVEPAAADLDRLYLLTYRDPQYMVRLAELRVPSVSSCRCRESTRNCLHHRAPGERRQPVQSGRATARMEPPPRSPHLCRSGKGHGRNGLLVRDEQFRCYDLCPRPHPAGTGAAGTRRAERRPAEWRPPHRCPPVSWER